MKVDKKQKRLLDYAVKLVIFSFQLLEHDGKTHTYDPPLVTKGCKYAYIFTPAYCAPG